ncbi:helix-turn-helix transcriptional regulator [Paenibacillus hodogayensis]|uniref:Helix-turn-helix transcriptional regulator n=1 Tax=Paenibacillus hodogayensis TaxID=279208 RepID=A0ABV5VVY6_9BACL
MALQIGRSLLKHRIKRAKLTQKEFANRLGVGQSFITMVIKGEHTMSLERAVNAAKILDCDVTDLHEWLDVPLSMLRKAEEQDE